MPTRNPGDSDAGSPPVPPRRAGWMLVGTAVLWGGAGLLVRGAPLAGPQLAFWRSLAGAATYHAVLGARGKRINLSDLRTAALGGVGFGLSLVLQFVAYKSTTLVSANVIFALQPLVLAVVARRLHGDRHDTGAIVLTIAAVVGTVIVVAGSASNGAFSIHGDVAALAAMAVGCLYPIGIKKARTTMGALEFQSASLTIAAVVTLPAAAFTRAGLSLPPGEAWLWIAGIVAVGGTGHLLFTSAQRHVSVMASSTITLLEIAVVALGAALAFHQRVTVVQVAGIVVVAVAVGWWMAREEGQAP